MRPTNAIDTTVVTPPVLLIDAIPEPLRPDLAPVLDQLVQKLHPEGLWLFGSWVTR